MSATNVYAADNGGVRDSKEVIASTGKDENMAKNTFSAIKTYQHSIVNFATFSKNHYFYQKI
ncbi:hypothetical protein [Ornithobacterium rhinotracheale]|uniref:hypothetical protein n=1 Tax=Ornithobacterium rhinotracheale TaxID=28251 RepID=UPI003872E92E